MKRIGLPILLVLALLITGFTLVQNLKLTEPTGFDPARKIDAKAMEQILMTAEAPKTASQRRHSGVQAPSLTLKTLEGETVTIGGSRNRPVLIHFWASWCEACAVEAPTLKRLHEQYKDHVDFYGINVSTEEKNPERISAFMRMNGLAYPTLMDENKRAAYLYELHALPTTFLIDKDGYIADTFHMADPIEFEQKLERLSSE